MKDKCPKARLIAYYLPQYHQIPENDEWWGKGFTEWTNVARAKPLFKGHYQPHIPADLGFYDLRVPETREAQAEMAEEHGIEAFCYWHYWFNGRKILERPFNEVLSSKQPAFKFCLAWANQTWSGIWHGASDQIFIEQTYPGMDDHTAHFYTLLKAFSDERYVTIDGKPLFVIYQPWLLPDSKRVTDLWQELAIKAGLKGLYIVGEARHANTWKPQDHGYNAAIINSLEDMMSAIYLRYLVVRLRRRYHGLRHLPNIYKYKELVNSPLPHSPSGVESFPTILPNWDNTPRSGKRGIVFHGSNPELFRIHVKQELAKVADRHEEHRIVFIKSWNEWAEGNHLEPDQKFGKSYLNVLAEEVF